MNALKELVNLRHESKLVKKLILRLQKREVVITLKKHHQKVFVGDIAKLISIPEIVAHTLQSLEPVAKKYHSSELQNGRDYISCCGGFKKAIGKLYDLQRFGEGIIKNSNYNTFFGELLLLFQSMEGAAKQSYKRKYSIVDPICCFCWREVKKGKSYCYQHHPSLNELEYKKVRNHFLRVFNINKREFSSSELRIEFKKRIRNLLPQLDERHVKCEEKLSVNWRLKADRLISEVSKKYPLTFEKICHLNLDVCDTYSDYCVDVLTQLNGSALTKQDTDYIERSERDSVREINLELSYILRLHEAHVTIMSQNLKPGPKPRQIRSSTIGKLEQLSEILRQQIRENGKMNFSKAAKLLGISRQRVSVMAKLIFV